MHPGAVEICNGIDDDCDGLIDEADPDLDPRSLPTWYLDFDMDGHGDPANPIQTCAPPPDYVELGDDCDDNDFSVHPGAFEVCGDGIDQDCDGSDATCA